MNIINVEKMSFIVKGSIWLEKYSIFALVFLLPILFFPWTSEILDFNKQAVLLLLVFVSLFSWMLKVLISGKLEIRRNKLYIFFGILFLALLVSTVFSIDKYGSFWGWPQVTANSLATIIGFFVFYFILSSVFSKDDLVKTIYVFSVSAIIAQIIGILQLFGKGLGFNTLGWVGLLGTFSAVLLPLSIAMLIATKGWKKIFFILSIFFSATVLILVNFFAVWWPAALGPAIMIIVAFFKRNIFDARWLALPVFFMAVSLFFAVLSPQIKWLPRVNEVFLSQQAGFRITKSALAEKPILGSGPGTFSYNFLKFKQADLNKTAFWNVAFNSSSSKVMTLAAETGILGILTFLTFIFAALFFGAKSLFKTNSILAIGAFASFSSGIAAFFLNNSNVSMDFLFFFLLAILSAEIFEKREEYDLKPSSIITIASTFIFTLAFIFGMGVLILEGQRYMAEAYYFNGIKSLSAKNLDAGIKNLEKSASINSASDLYFRQLAQAYLFKMQEASKDEKLVQQLAENSVNAAKIATDLGPKNANNWFVRGYIYQSLRGLLSDSSAWAVSSYNEALKLDPNNPHFLTQLGIVYFQDKDYQNAKTNFEKALELKPDYQNAQDGIKAIEGVLNPSEPEPAEK